MTIHKVSLTPALLRLNKIIFENRNGSKKTRKYTIPLSVGYPRCYCRETGYLGKLIINSITNNRVSGTINFRGTPIPINRYWNESTKQIRFDSPYAFSGHLTIFDDASIRIRHLILSGQFVMNPPSAQAGEYGYPHPKQDGGMRVGSIKLKQLIVILTFPYCGW